MLVAPKKNFFSASAKQLILLFIHFGNVNNSGPWEAKHYSANSGQSRVRNVHLMNHSPYTEYCQGESFQSTDSYLYFQSGWVNNAAM